MASDDDLAEFCQQWEISDVDDDDDDDEEESGFDLVPDSRRGKLICMIGAKLTGTPWRALYFETPYGQVLEEITLAMAASYTPKDEKETGARPR